MKKTLVAILVYQSFLLPVLLAFGGTASWGLGHLMLVPFFAIFLTIPCWRLYHFRGPTRGTRMWRLEKAKLPPGRVLGGPWRWLPHPPQDPHAPEEEWEQAKRELWQLYLAVLVALLTGALAILVWWNGATTSHPDRLSGWRRTESGISWTL